MVLGSNSTSTFNITTSIPGGGDGCPPVFVQLKGVNLSPLTVTVILGLLGNTVALWIFCFKLKVWKPNHVFLFNLVIADFMALVSLPLKIDALLRDHWVFGDALCRMNIFLMFSNRSASIALMTVVAIYRYFKVVHPHHPLNRMTKQQATLVSGSIWLLVISIWIPILTYNHVRGSNNNTRCFFLTSYKADPFIIQSTYHILMVLEFILALAILLFCSIRISCFLKKRQLGRLEAVRKAMKMCVAIIVVYMLCFLPGSLTTMGVWLIHAYRPWDCDALYTLTYFTIISFGLNLMNMALDPVIYIFSCSTFRRAVMDVLPRVLHCRQHAGESMPSS